MIQSFRCKRTAALFAGESPPAWRAVAQVARRKLAMLDAAQALRDLAVPPGNQLEGLSGDRAGQYSIRINERWRLCFVWSSRGPELVEIIDYHGFSREVRMNAKSVKPVNAMPAIHPGEILREEFLVPLALSVNALSLALMVPATRMHEIVNERRGITADTAYRLSRYFGTTPEFWLALQADYDIKTLPNRDEIDRKVDARPAGAAA